MTPSVGIYLPRGVGLCHRTTLSQHARWTFLSAPSSWEQGVRSLNAHKQWLIPTQAQMGGTPGPLAMW